MGDDGARRVYGDGGRQVHDDGARRMYGTASARRRPPAGKGEQLADWADGRLGLYALAKANMRKVVPDHWSFMLCEVTL